MPLASARRELQRPAAGTARREADLARARQRLAERAVDAREATALAGRLEDAHDHRLDRARAAGGAAGEREPTALAGASTSRSPSGRARPWPWPRRRSRPARRRARRPAAARGVSSTIFAATSAAIWSRSAVGPVTDSWKRTSASSIEPVAGLPGPAELELELGDVREVDALSREVAERHPHRVQDDVDARRDVADRSDAAPCRSAGSPPTRSRRGRPCRSARCRSPAWSGAPGSRGRSSRATGCADRRSSRPPRASAPCSR